MPISTYEMPHDYHACMMQFHDWLI